jgi:hypothetical protein
MKGKIIKQPNLWISEFNIKTLMFQLLLLGLKDKTTSPLSENSISEIEHHLLCLGANLQRYFPDIKK